MKEDILEDKINRYSKIDYPIYCFECSSLILFSESRIHCICDHVICLGCESVHFGYDERRIYLRFENIKVYLTGSNKQIRLC